MGVSAVEHCKKYGESKECIECDESYFLQGNSCITECTGAVEKATLLNKEEGFKTYQFNLCSSHESCLLKAPKFYGFFSDSSSHPQKNQDNSICIDCQQGFARTI